MTETLAQIEGLERGPAGNTSLAAAFSLAREMESSQIILVQETEYTGAGKHLQPQLSFARDNGIKLRFGDPWEEVPGESIILPAHPSLIRTVELDLDKIKLSYIRNCMNGRSLKNLTEEDLQYLADETKSDLDKVRKTISALEEREEENGKKR